MANAGTYGLTVTNPSSGCVSNAGTTNVIVNEQPATPTASSNSPVCVGSSIDFTASSSAGAIYNWSGPGFNPSSTFQNPSIAGATLNMAGTYTLTVTSNGCTSNPATVAVVVNNCGTVDLSVVKTVNNSHPIVGTNVEFTIVVTNNGTLDATGVYVTEMLQSGYTYVSSTVTAGTYDNATGTWTIGSIISGGTETLTVTATVNMTGSYSNTATVTFDGVDSKPSNNSSTIETTPEVLNIPEGFSPNGDGVNDVFVIRGMENYPNNTFVIFNRWGDKVYEANPYLNNWDGKSTTGLRVGGNELPIGTYFYVLDLGDGSKAIKGTIYLNR